MDSGTLTEHGAVDLGGVQVAADELLSVTRDLSSGVVPDLASVATVDLEHDVKPALDAIIAAIKRLEPPHSYLWETDLRLLRERIAAGRPACLVLDNGVRFSAAVAELAKRPANSDGPTLARAARLMVERFLRTLSRGHVELTIGHNGVTPRASDAQGEAVLAYIEQLAAWTPAEKLMPAPRCLWCGDPLSAERSSKKYCGDAHKRAYLRSRSRQGG